MALRQKSVLLIAAAATLLGGSGFLFVPALGEPDSARFLFGLWRWRVAGPTAAGIYDGNFSTGYYWLMAHLVGVMHLALPLWPVLLRLVSVGGLVATGVLALALGREWLGTRLATLVTLVWLVGPGVWWLGLEGHPQSSAVASSLGALLLWRGGRWWAAMAVLAAALLLRADAILFFPAFLLYRDRPRAMRQLAVVWCGAVVLYLAAQRWMLAGGLAQPELQGKTLGFIIHGLALARSPGYIVKQLMPIVTGAGPLVALAAFTGIVLLFRGGRRSEKRRWAELLVLWVAPQEVFWFLVLGNTARHVALAGLPILWAGAGGWQCWSVGRWRRPLATMAGALAGLVLVGAVVIPPSSDINMIVSPNVVASARELRRIETGLRREALTAAAGPRRCFLGTPATDPYVESELLLSATPVEPQIVTLVAYDRLWVAPDRDLRVFEVYDPFQYRRIAYHSSPPCARVYSLEFLAPSGTFRAYSGGIFDRWKTAVKLQLHLVHRSLLAMLGRDTHSPYDQRP